MIVQRVLLGTVAAVLLSGTISAQHTVFVVRHAERADSDPGTPAMMGADPDLSEAGRNRAVALASMLRDAQIAAIFVTEYKRTQQTAAPLARALGATPTVVPAKDLADLMARLTKTPGNTLVVGHSNTVSDVIKGLGVATPVTVGDDEFDHLFIVTPEAPPRVITLRYR